MNIVTEVAVCMGYSSLKPLQGEIVSSVVGCRDVFAILPTGYGKSFCLMSLPLVFNKLKAILIRFPVSRCPPAYARV